MPLLERESYLETVAAALQDAIQGEGRIALISGEAGIGKTSLVEQFVRQQASTVPVLWGACDALFTPRPLGPLHDIAAQTQGHLLTQLQQNATNAILFSTFLAELQGHPVIAVFEDVHWADEATLDLILYLGRRLNRTHALLILTYRDDELGQRHPLRSVLGDLSPLPITRRLPLAPISEKAVHHLIGDRGLDAAALHHQTGGNPFFVTEVLANEGNALPPTVQDAVLARLTRLSPAAQTALSAAAIIGPRLEPWLWGQLTGNDHAAADELLAQGLLLEQGTLFAFRHELIWQAVLAFVPTHQKTAWHRQVLAGLQTHPATQHDLARLAHHAAAANEATAVLTYTPTAAQQARAGGAIRSAAALYGLLYRYLPQLPPAEQAPILTDYSVVCDALDRRPQAINLRRQAADLWREAGNWLKCGESLGHLALLLHLTGENEQAEQVNNEAIALLEALPPNRELAIVYNSQALLHLATLDNARGTQMAEKNLALAQHLEDETLFPRLYETLGLCWLHLDHVKGLAYLEESLALALRLDQSIRSANTYSNLGSAYVEFHLFPQAEACFEKGLAYMGARDLASTRLFALAWRAQWHLDMGRWAAAMDDVKAVLELPGTSIGSRGPALIVLGRLRARRGEADADVALDESLDLLFKLGYRQREWCIRAARAEAAWLAGDKGRTLAEARLVYDRAIRQKHPWAVGELAFWQWRAGEMVMLPDWAAPPYALQIQGDWSAAAAAWAEMGCPYEQARALADGDTPAQLQALDIFDHLGAKPSAEALRQKLRQAGVPNVPRGPRPSTRENPFGLTSRQRDILTLLAQELTNSEIAARLHLSPKTVDHHVSAILAKLDVHTRTAAAAVAQQHNLV
ncbi:MAG: AAA family ATPase [Chloroflexi bacterium]|nr:AAA family ATPase [Chloroflexota bacterium]MBP8055493.1 AAA family ATPase [Chloroflexota bacterium]